jgi:hypothetical protein
VFFSLPSTTSKPKRDAFICTEVRVLPRTFAIECIDFFLLTVVEVAFHLQLSKVCPSPLSLVPPGKIQCFFPTNSPIMIPTRPEMVAKISLFQLPNKAMWATSRNERQMAIAIANSTPKTRRSFGNSTSDAVRPCITGRCRVRARLIRFSAKASSSSFLPFAFDGT